MEYLFTSFELSSGIIVFSCWVDFLEGTGKVKVKFSHTRFRALGQSGADPGVQAVSMQVTFKPFTRR